MEIILKSLLLVVFCNPLATFTFINICSDQLLNIAVKNYQIEFNTCENGALSIKMGVILKQLMQKVCKTPLIKEKYLHFKCFLM